MHQKFLCVNGPLAGQFIEDDRDDYLRYNTAFRHSRRRGEPKIPTAVLVHKDTLLASQPVKPKKKLLTCEDCGTTSEDVTETTCPFAEDVYGEKINIIACTRCVNQRAEDI
jgi:hypothetical protein